MTPGPLPPPWNEQFALSHELNEEHVHQLTALYAGEWWTKGRTLADVRRMLASPSLPFALIGLRDGALAAFARVLSDGVYRAFLYDVMVAPAHRGQGLGQVLMQVVMDHPAVGGVEQVALACREELAPFYARWGFAPPSQPIRLLQRPKSRPSTSSC